MYNYTISKRGRGWRVVISKDGAEWRSNWSKNRKSVERWAITTIAAQTQMDASAGEPVSFF